jgi:hypothetical protein
VTSISPAIAVTGPRSSCEASAAKRRLVVHDRRIEAAGEVPPGHGRGPPRNALHPGERRGRERVADGCGSGERHDPDRDQQPRQPRQPGLDAVHEQPHEQHVRDAAAGDAAEHGACRTAVDGDRREPAPPVAHRLDRRWRDERRRVPEHARLQHDTTGRVVDLNELLRQRARNGQPVVRLVQMHPDGSVGGGSRLGGRERADGVLDLAIDVAPHPPVNGHFGDGEKEPEGERPAQRQPAPERQRPPGHEASRSRCFSM